MTQTRFAEKIEMDRSNLNKIITGERVPNLFTLCYMCEILIANPVDALIAYQQDFVGDPKRYEIYRKEREK